MKVRKVWMLASLAAVLGVILSVGAGSASAFSCVSVDGNKVVLQLSNETVTLTKGNQSRILANGSECGGRTASDTETIFVVGQGANDTVVVDAGGGWFEPGEAEENTPENNGSTSRNEVEIILGDANGSGGVESLVVNGNAAPDVINVGDGVPDQDADDRDPTVLGALTLGDPADDEVGFVNLNGDDDADIYLNEDGANGTLPEPRAPLGGNVATVPPFSITVNGKGGNDFLSGKGGLGTGTPDLSGLTINGGDGDDSIQGGDAPDVISGGAGNDVIDGDDQQIPSDGIFSPCALLNAQEVGVSNRSPLGILGSSLGLAFVGGDTATYAGATGPITADLDPAEGHPGSATGEGTDVLQNIENLIGSPANDTLSGDNANNVLQGGPGDDTLAGDAGDDCVFGQDGNDTLDENEGTTTAQGGSGVDNGADILIGGTPTDLVGKGLHTVILDSGLDDVVTYSSRTTRVNVYLEPFTRPASDLDGVPFEGYSCGPVRILTKTGRAGVGPILVDAELPEDGADLDGDGLSGDDESDCIWLDVENAITGSGNDTISASFVNNRADNEFTGNGGNDRMAGGSGNDVFHEGSAASGADVMDGGTGTDSADYSGRSNALDVSLDGADNDGEAGEGDNVGGVFNLPVSSTFNAHGYLNPESQPTSTVNVENVQGGSGADVLNGSDQQNVLNGNAGNDSITGAGGQDVLNGGDGDDWVAGGLGNDAMNGGNGTDTVDYASAGSGGVGVNVNLATGQASGDGNDTLAGFENASGSSFADSVQGDAGNNVLNGRGGNDAIQGADGDDKVNGGSGNDELGGGAGNDVITGGNGSDAIRGGAGDDNLSGGPADDTLIGGDGNDVLSGGAGKDVHRGGPGTDRCNPGTPGLAAGDTAAGCES